MAIRVIPLVAERMPTAPIKLGRVGENQPTMIRVDVGRWADNWPDISIYLRLLRAGDLLTYTARGTLENGVYSYYLNAADTAKVGAGIMEIVGVSGDKVVASATVNTYVEQRMNGMEQGEEPPEPVQAWYEEALKASADAKQKVDSIKAITVQAETLPPESDATAVIDEDMRITFGIPRGKDGSGGGDVTKAYVDQQDEATLESAKSYTDDSMQDKIDKPEDAPAVGKVLTVKSVNEDGSFVCEWADCSDGISDVKVNGTSVVSDGVANIPVANANTVGVMSIDTGVFTLKSNKISILANTEDSIANRYGRILTAKEINDSVIASLTDAKRIALTAVQQATAQQVLGIVTLTQQEYDLLPVKGESTIYLIVG